MDARGFAATCAAAVAFAACGSVGPDWGFEESVDWDVGLGSTHGAADDAGAPALDPCGDPDALACDPLTNGGCDADAGYACSFDPEGGGGAGAFDCLSGSTGPEAGACDDEEGPWCGPGLGCSGGICAPLCCGAEDCAGGACEPAGYENVEGPFGVCGAAAPADGGLDG